MDYLERNWVSNTMSGYHTLEGAKITKTVVTEISMKQMMQFISDNWMEVPVHLRDGFKNKIQKMELGLIDIDVERPEDDNRW